MRLRKLPPPRFGWLVCPWMLLGKLLLVHDFDVQYIVSPVPQVEACLSCSRVNLRPHSRSVLITDWHKGMGAFKITRLQGHMDGSGSGTCNS